MRSNFDIIIIMSFWHMHDSICTDADNACEHGDVLRRKWVV